MMNFIVGFILGIVVSSVGFTTLASYADQGVNKIQQSVQEVTR
jgi:capsular polysaccharide biosynthesis protein